MSILDAFGRKIRKKPEPMRFAKVELMETAGEGHSNLVFSINGYRAITVHDHYLKRMGLVGAPARKAGRIMANILAGQLERAAQITAKRGRSNAGPKTQ